MQSEESSQREDQQKDLIEIPEELTEAQKEAVLQEKQRRQLLEPAGGEEKANFRDYDQSQIYYVAVRFKEFLEADHPARVVDAVVERMDLSPIYGSYSEEGNPPFHPKMMLKVLFYAYYKGLMSCRKIWDALAHRSDLIFLAAGQVPNFRTVNSFRLEAPGGATAVVFPNRVHVCAVGDDGFQIPFR